MAETTGSDAGNAGALRHITNRTFLSGCPDKIAELFHYWDERRGDRIGPRRADIGPEDFPRHLPGILLVDVEGTDESGTGIFRYRVVGTGEVGLRGHDPTGKRIEEGFFGPSLEDVIGTYELVRRERTFVYDPLAYKTPNNKWCDELTILLPLSEDGEHVSQVLVYSEKQEIKTKANNFAR